VKIIGINGSPRKTWNTATMLNEALKGAEDQGAETELIHLYDLNYKGCVSCFECRRIDGPNYGRCALKDDLAPVFEKIRNADGIIIGSPIYLAGLTGETRSFMERLAFQFLVYDPQRSSLFGRRIRTAFIYTMGATDEQIRAVGYEQNFMMGERVMERIFGSNESLYATDMYQFDDYSKYVSTAFDVEAKTKRRAEVFPEDCRKAYEMGIRMTLPVE